MNNKRVVILRGIPGAGKSTYVKRLFAEAGLRGESIVAVSADHFFVVDGAYRFVPQLLGRAHAACLRNFTDVLTGPATNDLAVTIVVDNTNTRVSEMNPYVKLAQAYEVPFEVVTVDCLPEIAIARGVHGVPAHKVWEMHRRLTSAEIPADWPHRVAPAGSL